MKKTNIVVSVFIVMLLPYCLTAQENDRTGLNYGFHVGWQWVGNAEAAIYETGTEGNLNLSSILISNTTNYTKLKDYYNDDFSIYELPHNTKYKPTLSFGGTLQYYTSNTFAIYMNALFSRPSITHCSFSIKLKSKTNSLSNEIIEQGYISGKENRLQLELGLHKTFPLEATVIPFIDVAFATSFLEMKNHELSIGNLNLSLMQYSRTDTNTNYTKWGMGTSCGTGVQFPLANKFYVYTGLSLSVIHYGIVDKNYSFTKSIDIKILL